MRRSVVAVAAVAVALAGGCTASSGQAPSGTSLGDSSSGLGSLFSVPPWSAAFSLLPVDGVQPLRTTTSIGVLEWTMYAFPEGREFGSPLATQHGPVALSAPRTSTQRPRFLWSQDSVAWDGAESDIAVGHLARAGEDVVLYETRDTVPRAAKVDAVRYAWNGSRWARSAELDLPGPLLGLAYGPEDAVATYDSVDGVLFAHSSDGVTFAAVDGPAAEDLKGDDCGYTYSGWGPQVLATRDGFVAMTPSNRMDWGHQLLCEPVTWTSADGTAWTLRTPKSPFDDGVVVDSVAEHEGRFVAVGGEPGVMSAAWTSGDAVAWEPIGFDLTDIGPLTVSSAPLGWIITGGHYTVEGVAEVFMWTSPDGVSWDGPHTLPNGLVTGYYYFDLSVGTDTILGIGDRGPTPVVARVVG
jgi:hypothetical protein